MLVVLCLCRMRHWIFLLCLWFYLVLPWVPETSKQFRSPSENSCPQLTLCLFLCHYSEDQTLKLTVNVTDMINEPGLKSPEMTNLEYQDVGRSVFPISK